jgi:hypothetical protein
MRSARKMLQRKTGLLIVDRDGESFEVEYACFKTSATPEEEKIGRHFFGHLRIADKVLNFATAT